MDLEERVTKIETILNEKVQPDLAEALKELKCIREDLSRYRGFFGGILFVVSSLWAFVRLVLPWLNHKT